MRIGGENMLDRFSLRSRYARPSQKKKEKRLLLSLNGHRWEGWESVKEIWEFIKGHEQVKSCFLAPEQDPEGKWTVKLVLEAKESNETLRAIILKKAKSVHPNVSVSFEEIKTD